MLKKVDDAMAYVEDGDSARAASEKVLGSEIDMWSNMNDAIGIPEKVDGCIGFLDATEMTIEKLKEYEDLYKRKRVAAENIRDGYMNHLKFLMHQHPDKPLEGKSLRCIALKKNPEKVDLLLKLKTETGCITSDDIEFYGIPSELVESKIVYKLADKKTIKEFIKKTTSDYGHDVVEDGKYILGSTRFAKLFRDTKVVVK